ncbi:MAG: PorV/PorQ family protein [bacterium]
MKQLIPNKIKIILMVLLLPVLISAQKPTRVGTTAANFLEIGFGAAGSSMGDAQVSMANDVSAMYWNPAGLARLSKSEVMFVTQPWIADMNTSFSAVGIVVPDLGTFGAGVILMDYGEMEVTTMAMQEGTGEKFTPKDMAIYVSYARSIVDWFSFGVSGKIVNSNIWHLNATALAFDLGVLIKTPFFSPTDNNEEGMSIGMSISNYGTPMKYDGLDLLNPIDVSPDEAGNYRDASGQFRLQEWELPLIFRIGTSVTPFKTGTHELILSADALHPNNNSESVNFGGQYSLIFPTFGKVILRGGYKALFMENSQYGFSFGIGVRTDMLFNTGVKLEYAYRDVGLLGNVNSFGISLLF